MTFLILGGSLLLRRPALGAFAERPVVRELVRGTAMLAFVHAAAGAANFLLNLSIVTASFGTDEFNAQVAKVNAITRLAIGLPEGLATGLAIWLVYRALFPLLPGVPGEGFWELVGRREARRGAQREGEEAPGGARAAARGEGE